MLSDERFTALMNRGDSVVWHADAAGNITQAWRWDRLSEQQGTEYRGFGWLEALHPDDRDHAEEAWRRALATGKLPPLEYRVRRLDGSYRLAVAKAVAVRDSSGAIAEWIGTVADIQAEAASGNFGQNGAEMLRLAIEASGIGVWQLELATRRTDWSRELKQMAGLQPDAQIDDELFYGLVHPDDRAAVEAKITAAIVDADVSPYEIEYRLFRADTGELRWLHEWGRMVTDIDNKPIWIVGAIQDVTERVRGEADRHINEERWRLALRAGRMVAWNSELKSGRFSGSVNAVEVLGHTNRSLEEFLQHVHPADRVRFQAIAEAEPNTPVQIEFRYTHANGQQLWLEARALVIVDDPVSLVVGITADITEKKAAQTRLLHAATHDALTGLPNRALLKSEFDRLLAEAAGSPGDVAILLIDIDHFKDVNDTLGHDTGDHLLQAMASRLQGIIGEDGFVARLGGDEFAVILPRQPSPASAERSARALLRVLAEPVEHNGTRLSIRSTIGISLYPRHGLDPSELLKDADLALYAAKTGGRYRTALYDPRMREAMERRVRLLSEVRSGLDAGQIQPFYQPKVDMKTGAVIGFEALARWLHPDQGLLGPAHFNDVFDDPELALRIDETILRHVVRDTAAWLADGVDPGRIAVNFSGHTIRNPNVVDWVREILAAHGLSPERIEIEIPETVFMGSQIEEIGNVLRLFHECGFTIALDDFGTGFASLTHLKRFPVDVIKVDQSFVRDLEEDADDAAIVSAVIGLGHALGITVVAEGVSTPGQASALAKWECPIGQGYLFARPMDPSCVPAFLRQGQAEPRRTGALG